MDTRLVKLVLGHITSLAPPDRQLLSGCFFWVFFFCLKQAPFGRGLINVKNSRPHTHTVVIRRCCVMRWGARGGRVSRNDFSLRPLLKSCHYCFVDRCFPHTQGDSAALTDFAGRGYGTLSREVLTLPEGTGHRPQFGLEIIRGGENLSVSTSLEVINCTIAAKTVAEYWFFFVLFTKNFPLSYLSRPYSG